MKTKIKTDTRYELLADLGVVEVPKDYQHATRLTSFTKAHKDEFYYFNDALTDKNFASVTTKLEPGRRLHVRAFRIKERVTSDDNLKFIASQNGVLTGAQGASLVYEQMRDKLPKDKWYVSFDQKDALWKDSDGCHRVPRVDAYSGGDFNFHLDRFEDDWGDGLALLVFSDSLESQTLDPDKSLDTLNLPNILNINGVTYQKV